MADTAARLLDRVVPRAPVRQWVLSLPYPIRFLLAYHPERCREVRNLFLRTLFSWLEGRARETGIADPRCGAVNFLQRFGRSLNLNPHFHALLLDGVYTPGPYGKPRFHSLPSPSDEEVAALLRKARSRILRHLQIRGLLSSENQLALGTDPDREGEILEACQAGSIQGKIALGPRGGALVTRLGEGRIRGPPSPPRRRAPPARAASPCTPAPASAPGTATGSRGSAATPPALPSPTRGSRSFPTAGSASGSRPPTPTARPTFSSIR